MFIWKKDQCGGRRRNDKTAKFFGQRKRSEGTILVWEKPNCGGKRKVAKDEHGTAKMLKKT